MFTLEFFLCQTKFIQNSFYSLEDWASRPRLQPTYDKIKCAHGYNRMRYSVCVKCFYVPQVVEHCACNAKVRGLIPRVYFYQKRLAVRSKCECINATVNL